MKGKLWLIKPLLWISLLLFMAHDCNKKEHSKQTLPSTTAKEAGQQGKPAKGIHPQQAPKHHAPNQEEIDSIKQHYRNKK